MSWTLETVIAVELVAVLSMAAVAAWASGASWRDITGIGDPVSHPDAEVDP